MNTLSKFLTWLGVVPFLAPLLIKLFNPNLLGVTPDFLFLLYSTIIISFMAGALWGRSKHQKNSPHNSTLIITNLWALCAYFTLILVNINPMYMNVSLLILSIGSPIFYLRNIDILKANYITPASTFGCAVK